MQAEPTAPQVVPNGYRLQPISEFDAYADVLRQINNLEEENARLKNEIAAVSPQGGGTEAFRTKLEASQEPLGLEASKILADNAWSSDAAPASSGEAKAVAWRWKAEGVDWMMQTVQPMNENYPGFEKQPLYATPIAPALPVAAEKDTELLSLFQKIDSKCSGGLCCMNHGGTREFLKDIRELIVDRIIEQSPARGGFTKRQT